MQGKFVTELVLEGLNCAECGAKIEKRVLALAGVTAVSVNIINKTLILEAEEIEEVSDLINKVKDIVKKIEPDVMVREKRMTQSPEKVLILMGLDCAHCASKIEQGIAKIPGVKTASLDFLSKKLKLEVNNKAEIDRIIDQIDQLINKIEPGVSIVEKEKAGAKKEENRYEENKKELWRLGIGAGLFALALFPFENVAVKFALFLISYLLIGGEVLLRAGRNILRGQVFDENFLMTIATLGAFAIKEYPEGVAVMLFYQIGEFFQDQAVNRSRRSIKALLDIRPDYVNLKIDNETKKVSPEEVTIGDLIIIKAGERIPLDGKVMEGQAMLDTSALTGESVPRKAEPGDDVLSGVINKDGLLTVKVTKEYQESTIAKILDLVENAGSKKAPTENFITKFAHYYTPVVVFAACAIALIPPLIIDGASFSQWFYRALVFLVISCPCALVISIPLGFFGGIGSASKRGILIKGGNYLEALNQIDSVIFDKTGTLTKGVFKVTKIRPQDPFTEEEVLNYAASAEVYSNHPIAQSIINAYTEASKTIDKNEIQEFSEISGLGVKVKYQGQRILAGNHKLMENEGISYEKNPDAGTVVYVAVDTQFAGSIVISDEIKEDAAETVKGLRKAGIKKLVMLTGDNQATGQRISDELGLDEVYAELLPGQKVEALEKIVREKTGKGAVVFVGDGLNDAPVLARADVGVAMGGLGSDAAIEAADIVLMTDEPIKFKEAIAIAGKTRRVVWQNIIFSVGVKIIVLLLGAGGLATLWEAVFADVGVALLAVFNAMRLLK
ncbi:MAG: heavy metal translocating P-type ATPase [Bacillota bacterium]|jgi:Cd2+/Zn2+-exporting ATPase